MASSSGLDLKTARHLSAALQIPFDRAQAVGSLRLFRPHHFQQLSKQRQGIGLTIQLSCPLKPFLHPGSWRIGSYMLDQNSSAACMERHPVAFTVPIERRPKITWGLLRQIQPRIALSKPMRCPCPQRPKILKWTAVKIQLPVSTPGLARRSRLLLRDHRAPAPAPAQVLVLMAMLVNSNGTAACTAATTTSQTPLRQNQTKPEKHERPLFFLLLE